MKSVKEGNKCVWKVLNSKTVNCKNVCPLPKEKKSRCLRGKQAVMKVTFRNVGNVCLFNVIRVGLVNCEGCSKKPIYTVGKCEKNQKNTSLTRISFRQVNTNCIKRQVKVLELPCQCYGTTETNVTVTFGRECVNGFLSRVAELNVLKEGKCSKVAFKLTGVRCRKPCDRRTKIVVGKCKSNKRSVTILRAVRENNQCKWKTVTSKFVKCKNICPSPKEKRSRCILKKQAIFRVTFKEVGETCQFNLIRLNIVPCIGCQNSTYRVEKCEKNAKETSLIRTLFNEINGTCIKKEVIVKKLSCRCTGNTTRNIEVVVGKQCENGYISRVLELTEERNDKCVKVSFKLRRIRCQRPCSRRLKLVVNKCVSSKRLIQRMKSVKEGNKCVWKVLNSKTVNCKNVCPLPKEKKSRCLRGKQAVMKVTFRNVGNVCLFNVIRVGLVNCEGCSKKPIYTVGKCEKNQKNTSLTRISFRQVNTNCIKRQVKVLELPCQCYGTIETNVTVTFGRECVNGFLSRVAELNVLKEGKCSKVAFKLTGVRCRKPCDRRTKIVVGKCKSNKRSVTILRAVRENNQCKWKTVTSKFAKCKNICPSPKEKRSRCILKKQAIFRVTFKEVGETCQFNLIRLNIVPCIGCQNSTYRVEKCEKNAKETSLIRTLFNEINGTCIKKEVIVKKLSCRCTGNTTRNIEVVVGKQCENGYISRVLELTEERNDKCVKVSFKLRRIRCQRPCSRRLKLVVNKCVSSKRLIQRMKSVKEGNKCVLKVLNSKTVNCKEICPLPSFKRSRCYRGMQAVTKITFKLIGNICVPQFLNLNISKCQKCPRSVYRIEKCEKNSNQTFLIRTFFQSINGNCLRKERKLKALPCKCYDNITRNVSLIIDKECRNGYKSRVLELSIEKNLKCIKDLFKLRSIRCENVCNKTETRTDSCVFNKRFLKLYKQVERNGRCDWVLVSSKLVNCTNQCPNPKITTTPCINEQRYLVRTTHQLVGNRCVSSEQKVKLLKCQKCFRKSVYEIKECSKNSKTSELIRISHRNCTKKIEKLIDVDCSCESYNNYGINVTSVASCINGFRLKTVSFFTTVNGKCVLRNLSVKGGKCGCFDSSYTLSICVNGNRTLEKHTKYQSGSQCLSKLVLNRKLRCKSICPINSIVLSRRCYNNRKLNVFGVYEQSGNHCKLGKFNFKWSQCSTKPISDVICSKSPILTMSNCHNGSAFIIYTKFDAKMVNGKCVGNSSKIAEIACSGRCERTIRPKLVSGKCVKNIKLLFFIASRPQGIQCLHKIDYLGKIDCKNC